MTTPTSTPGRTVGGRYALLNSVGAGGMGTVWRAHDQLLRRDVAVKEVLLPPGVPKAERQMLCERTLREARAAASLNNPSVVRIYDVVEEDDRPWIVMELVDARSLADIINEGGPLPPVVVADVGLQVLGALEAAHAAGILHRDVKPGNILLAADGRATLTDFGVARALGDSALTSTGLLLGSPSYIPPERARGRPAIPASDLWSLGATLYAAVEGHPPYDKGDPLPTLTAIVSDPPPPFTLAGPLRPVLSGLLEKLPEQRFDVRRARDGFNDALGVSRADRTRSFADSTDRRAAPPPPPPVPAQQPIWQAPPAGQPEAPTWRGQQLPSAPATRPGPPRRRGRTVALVVGLVALLASLAAGGYYYYFDRTNVEPTTHASAPTPTPSAEPVTPAGYFRFTHPGGFSVAIPNGWREEILKPSGVIQFRDPADNHNGGRFVRLVSAQTNRTMSDYWVATNKSVGPGLKGYRLVGISDSKAGSRASADWEFTHTVPGPRHVIDRGFIIDGTIYAFYFSTREDQFAASKSVLDTISGSFALTR